MGHPRGTAAAPSARRVGVAVASLCLVQFMDVLGVTVVVTSLPAMLASLHAPESFGSLITTGYAMFFGGLLMLGGRRGPVRLRPGFRPRPVRQDAGHGRADRVAAGRGGRSCDPGGADGG